MRTRSLGLGVGLLAVFALGGCPASPSEPTVELPNPPPTEADAGTGAPGEGALAAPAPAGAPADAQAPPPGPTTPWLRARVGAHATYRIEQDGVVVEERYEVTGRTDEAVVYRITRRLEGGGALGAPEERRVELAEPPPAGAPGVMVDLDWNGRTLRARLVNVAPRTRHWASPEVPPFLGGLVRMEQGGEITHELTDYSWAERGD